MIYILKFLNGLSKGYPLDGKPEGRLGIQVSSFTTELNPKARADRYAYRACNQYPDYLVVLVGSIEGKYLDAQPNSYEAGIKAEHFNKINMWSLNPLSEYEAMCHISMDLPPLDNFFADIKADKLLLPEGLLRLYNDSLEEFVASW